MPETSKDQGIDCASKDIKKRVKMIRPNSFEDGAELGKTYINGCHMPLISVGWLGQSQDFKTGHSSHEFVEKLTLLISDQRYTVTIYRGYFPCAFCGYNGMLSDVQPEMGGGILLLPGENVCFICPDMILHYVATHQYLPPQPFFDAVMSEGSSDFDAESVFSRSELII